MSSRNIQRSSCRGPYHLFAAILVGLIFASNPVLAKGEKDTCHDKCYKEHNSYNKVLVAHDPLGQLVCSCLATDGQVIGAYVRMGNGSWLGIRGLPGMGPANPRDDGGTAPAPPPPAPRDDPPLVKPTPPRQSPETARDKVDRPVEFEFFVGAGLNACLKSGNAKCSDVDPSAGLFFAPGLRIAKFFGLYMDVNFGWFNVDIEDTDMVTMSIIPMARFFFDFEVGELFGGLGAGYSRLVADGWAPHPVSGSLESLTVVQDGWFNPKFSFGITFKVAEPVSLGFTLDYLANVDGAGERCETFSGSPKACLDTADLDSVYQDKLDQLLLNAVVKLKF